MLVEMGNRLNLFTPIILAVVILHLTVQLAAVAESSTSGVSKWNYDDDVTTTPIPWTTPTLTTLPTIPNAEQSTTTNGNSINNLNTPLFGGNGDAHTTGSSFREHDKIVDILSDSKKVLQRTLIELVKQKTTTEEFTTFPYTATSFLPTATHLSLQTISPPSPWSTAIPVAKTTNTNIVPGTSPATDQIPLTFQNASTSGSTISIHVSPTSSRYFMTPTTTKTVTSGPASTSTVNIGNTTAFWPVKHASVVEGDVILGGLMMVHSREDSITCGPIMPQGGIQALEAMLYTLDQVNENQLLPNITLGAHILDDCDKDTYGLEMAVDFIKDDPSSLANVNTLVEVQDADLYEAKDLPGTSNEFQRQLDNLLDTDSVVSDACQRNDFDSDDDLDDPVPDFHLNSDSDLSEETERAGQLLEANLMGEKVNRGVRKLKKNTGQGYINSSGKFVASKEVRNLENCRLNCKAKILPEVQRNIFEQYWKLGNYNLRVAFAAGLIILSEKKTQRKTTTHLRNRTHVNTFFLEVGGERIQVCQKCFRFTLCETEQFIKTVVKKKLESPGTTISQDRRGRKIPPNKLNDAKQIEIRSHIQSFPAYESHYTRKQSQQKYLHADLSLSQMYRLFTEKYGETVSLTTYSKIFKTMNIKFKKPQLDTCNKCETFHMKLKTSSGNEKKQFEEELKAHQEDADLAYDSKKKEKIRCQNDQSKKVFTFDLQQCLPTPFLRTNISFYKRQLWTYNLTVHDGATNQPFCYMWHEGEGRRGGNEIASCLFEHLKSLPETCNQVVFYSDCCGGQNKNSFVSTMFLVFMQTESSIQTIDHKFLVPGHTHMECDTDHAAIERKKKRTSVDIHHPRDWYQFVRTVVAKKPFVVNEMSREKFFDFSRTSKEKFLWRKVDESGNKFIWQQIKWVRYEKKFAVIMYKTSLSEEEPFKILNLKRRGVLNVLPSDVPLCYMEPLALSKEKKKDLMDLLPLIDTSFHSFYKNLPSTENIPNYHPDLTEETDNETS